MGCVSLTWPASVVQVRVPTAALEVAVRRAGVSPLARARNMPRGRRSRFDGDVDRISAVLSEHVGDVNFCKDIVDMTGGQKVAEIMRNKALIKALFDLSKSGTFSQTQTKAAFAMIAPGLTGLKDTDRDQRCDEMAKRLRGLCKHLSQSRFKLQSVEANWTRAVLGQGAQGNVADRFGEEYELDEGEEEEKHEDEENEEEVGGESVEPGPAPAPAPAPRAKAAARKKAAAKDVMRLRRRKQPGVVNLPDWLPPVYGWNSELCAAWRADRTAQDPTKWYTKDLLIGPGGDDAPVVARWDDGFMCKIRDVTNKELKMMSMKAAAPEEPFKGEDGMKGDKGDKGERGEEGLKGVKAEKKSDTDDQSESENIENSEQSDKGETGYIDMWAGTHAHTGEALRVCATKDRYILTQKKSQILKVNMNNFVSRLAAYDVIVTIAKRYSAGGLSQDELKSVRDRMMTAGGDGSGAAGRQRPGRCHA